MPIAAIYDIHANLPALEAVLEEIRQANVEQVVVGGDVLPGPMPRESIEYLQHFDIPVKFIRGNGDRVVLAQMRGTESSEVPLAYRGVIGWNAEQLTPEHERFLGSWPETLRMRIPGVGDVLFCHATPRNDTDVFTRLTPEEWLLPVFEGASAAVVVCGHTHMQFDRRTCGTRVVNAGSVGMPFGEPGADWLLLGPDVQLRHTTYDFAKAAQRIRSTKYPQAEDFAENNVLHPPAEEAMLEAFTKASLKDRPS